MGAIGYFPSYTLGAMMACQFFEAAKEAIPDLEESLADGNFEPLKTWLNKEVRLPFFLSVLYSSLLGDLFWCPPSQSGWNADSELLLQYCVQTF